MFARAMERGAEDRERSRMMSWIPSALAIKVLKLCVCVCVCVHACMCACVREREEGGGGGGHCLVCGCKSQGEMKETDRGDVIEYLKFWDKD